MEKHVHVFEKETPTPYAVQHNLGSRDVMGRLADEHGEKITLVSFRPQDEGVVVISTSNSIPPGARLVLFG